MAEQLTVYSSTNDGMIGIENDGDWDTAHDATEGADLDDFSAYCTMGTAYVPANWALIYRSFVFFDTSSIPSNAIIDSATLSLYGHDETNITTNFNIVIQNGQTTYPHDPLVVGDYLYTHYSGNGGQISTSGWKTNDYNVITITELSWIQKGSGAKTKLALLSSFDIGNNPPESEMDLVAFWSADETEAGELRPRLVVNYHVTDNTIFFGCNF